MNHQKSIPITSKYFIPALVFGLNVQVSGVKMGCFHKVLPNVKSAYVTLQNFTPDLQKFYTDISAVSATLSNTLCSGVTTTSAERILSRNPCELPTMFQSRQNLLTSLGKNLGNIQNGPSSSTRFRKIYL